MVKKFILLFVCILFSCAEDIQKGEKNNFSNIKIKGNWRVVPSQLQEKLVLNYPKPSFIIYGNSSQKEKIDIELDETGFQIYVGGISMGYFLFAEKEEKIWTGLWDDRVVNLKLFDY